MGHSPISTGCSDQSSTLPSRPCRRRPSQWRPGATSAPTSTLALNNATLPFVIALAEKGTRRALEEDEHLRHGLNVAAGVLTNAGVAASHRLPCVPAEEVLLRLL